MDGMPLAGAELPESGDEIAGKYRIESVLGQGGMGAVFSAQNLLTGKRVAIKWLLPELAGSPSRERLLREARIACSIEHPNVVDIYDVGEHQGGLFLVMEYLRGRPLSDVLAEQGRMDPESLIEVLIPAMRGVHAAHQVGVIHRDLKPENIILSEIDGQVVPKVVDFGVSKTVGASSLPNSSLTRTGALVGTPHYMALEQVDGSNLVDPRTDVYAFGVIMYRALTGHFPFDGSSLGEVILKIGTKEPAPLRSHRPELSAALEAVVLKSTARAREQRFASLEEFARALEPFAPWVRFRESAERSGRLPTQLLLSSGVDDRADTTPAPPNPSGDAPQPISAPGIVPRDTPAHHLLHRARRARAFWLGAAAALVLLIAGFAWLSQRVSEPVATPLPPAQPAQPETKAASVVPTTASAPPSAAMEVADDAPTPGTPMAQPPGAGVPTIPVEEAVDTAPPSDVEEPRSSSRRGQRRASRQRDAAAQRGVIPGERTRGLSSDEF